MFKKNADLVAVGSPKHLWEPPGLPIREAPAEGHHHQVKCSQYSHYRALQTCSSVSPFTERAARDRTLMDMGCSRSPFLKENDKMYPDLYSHCTDNLTSEVDDMHVFTSGNTPLCPHCKSPRLPTVVHRGRHKSCNCPLTAL